ncbi:hypothetical protein [Marinimicrobium sp. ARAG 43.8]|uniref:hypothetical protein n=1 Tax=Marinimicrobium sp. ARAG 43.8 TaxID=3418719 RepID=UPI003CF75643
MKFIFIFFSILFFGGCIVHSENDEMVVCPKVKKQTGDELYCSIPYVEMQANYNNLDGVQISVDGVLSLVGEQAVLVAPYTKDYEIPQHYNVVALETEKANYEQLRDFHGKYVTVFGKFNARYGDGYDGMNMIAHSIKNPEVFESSP